MAEKAPTPQIPLGDTTEEEKKERLSDTSGERDSGRAQSLNPVTGKPVAELDGDKVELTEEDCYDELGFSFSNTKKWYVPAAFLYTRLVGLVTDDVIHVLHVLSHDAPIAQVSG
jgi:hypothetical protein